MKNHSIITSAFYYCMTGFTPQFNRIFKVSENSLGYVYFLAFRLH